MRLLLTIKNILKNIINTNNIVFLLDFAKNANYFYISAIIFVVASIVWFPFLLNTIPNLFEIIPNFKFIIKMLPQIIFILVYSICFSILLYIILFKRNNFPKRILTYSKIKGVSRISNFFDYYYTLVPIFLSTTGIVLVTLLNIHFYFLLVGIVLFFLGGYVFFIFFLLKFTFYKMGTYDTYNNITRANDILINYISPSETNIKYLAIKEFTKHFKRVLDGIDFHFEALFEKRINIDYLISKENITVKQLIIRYLPLYLSFCSEAELNSFKTKINSMTNFIDKENTITSLDILKVIYSIHQDIATFLSGHSYGIPKDTLIDNLIYNIKKRSFTFTKAFVLIFIIIGLLRFFIPYKTLIKAFETFNGTFSNVLGNHTNIIALIPPFIALIPIIYKMLKDKNE